MWDKSLFSYWQIILLYTVVFFYWEENHRNVSKGISIVDLTYGRFKCLLCIQTLKSYYSTCIANPWSYPLNQITCFVRRQEKQEISKYVLLKSISVWVQFGNGFSTSFEQTRQCFFVSGITMYLSLIKPALRTLKMETIVWGPRKLVVKKILGRGYKDWVGRVLLKGSSVPILGVPALVIAQCLPFFQLLLNV